MLWYNTSAVLVLSRLIRKLEIPKFGYTKTNRLVDQKEKPQLHMMIWNLLKPLSNGSMKKTLMEKS